MQYLQHTSHNLAQFAQSSLFSCHPLETLKVGGCHCFKHKQCSDFINIGCYGKQVNHHSHGHKPAQCVALLPVLAFMDARIPPVDGL
jgi:hypothetical protein